MAISKVLGLHVCIIMPSPKVRFFENGFIHVTKPDHSYFQCTLKAESVDSAKKPDSQVLLTANLYTDTHNIKVLMTTFPPTDLFLLP